MIRGKIIKWDDNSTPHYIPTYLLSPVDNLLCAIHKGRHKSYTPWTYKKKNINHRYQTAGTQVILKPDTIHSLQPVDVAHYKMYLQVIGNNNIHNRAKQESPNDVSISPMLPCYITNSH